MQYVEINEQGYVTWKKGASDSASVAGFAAAAIAYAKTKALTPDGTATAANGTATIPGLPLGYYLVDSSLGALCALDTTTPTATIKEKNSESTIVKEVQEGTEWGKQNDADIGDTISFRTTITVIDGDPVHYVLHDKMTNMVFQEETLVVKVGEKTLVSGKDYTLRHFSENAQDDGCTFEIAFADTTEGGATSSVLRPNDVVTITYSAILDESAKIASDGNPNETNLTYGENSSTAWSTTRTYTWQIDVEKYTMKNGTETKLAGAKFVLYRKGTNGSKEYVVVDESNKVLTWTSNAYDSKETEKAHVFVTPDNGRFSITGLDSGTYYLEEIEAPAGYNTLAEPITVVITASYDNTTNVGTAAITYNATNISSTDNKIKVENKSGALLPSTGGIGTTIFYVLGGVLVLGAAILLITKKRMSRAGD